MKYDWNQEQQGWILSSFYIGYVVTHIPGGIIAERYGLYTSNVYRYDCVRVLMWVYSSDCVFVCKCVKMYVKCQLMVSEYNLVANLNSSEFVSLQVANGRSQLEFCPQLFSLFLPHLRFSTVRLFYLLFLHWFFFANDEATFCRRLYWTNCTAHFNGPWWRYNVSSARRSYCRLGS